MTDKPDKPNTGNTGNTGYTLVIAGGSVKGFAMLGAIQYIHERHGLHNIHSFVGTSIGAIISYMLCIGMSPLEIVHSVISSDILTKIQTNISLDMLFTQQGMVSFEHFNEELELITLSKHGELFTMKSLYTTLQKELCCVTFNYSLNKMQVLHYTTTPDLPCLMALQMSCCIPFVFQKTVYQDHIYIDGGIADNYPIRVAQKLGKQRILGISANTQPHSTPNESVESGESKESGEAPQQIEMMKLITLPIELRTQNTIRKYRKRHLLIDIPISQHILQFDLDIPEIMDMFSIGYKVCKTRLEMIQL